MKKDPLTVKQLLITMSMLVFVSMLLLALIGLRNVQQLNEGLDFVANTGKAVRRQVDADMMHDAIRGDVLGVILATRDGQAGRIKEIGAELKNHITRFEENFAENSRAGLSKAVNDQIVAALHSEKSYSNMALAIVASALRDGAVQAESIANFQSQFEAMEVEMKKLADLIQQDADWAAEAAEQRVTASRTNTVLVLTASFIVFTFLVWYLFRRIARPLDALVKMIQTIDRTGDFSLRPEIKTKDELGQVAASFSGMMDTLQGALSETHSVMAAVAKGDFRKRLQVEARGDIQHLKESVNASVDKLEFTMTALTEVMEALHAGDFTKRVDGRVEGDFKRAVDNAMISIEMMLDDIGNVMSRVALGDISQRVMAEGYGNFAKLKSDINQSLEALACLHDIERAAGAMAAGDLTETINKSYPGTFGSVIAGINGTGENLKRLIGDIKTATDTINMAAKEIAAGNSDLSQRTEEQAASLQQTAASMDQLTSTVQANAHNAHQANELAQGAAEIAAKGGSVVRQVMTTMDTISESSRKIADIISVIDGIAFQTNILALNAAVEAARAGNNGRGFAVVAGEVRNLAHRAAAAAGEIKELIGDSVGKVEDGGKLVTQAGLTMQEIVRAITQVSGIIAGITASSNEQSAGIQQVNMTIGQMDDVTQQNAALVEQAAAAAESLEDQADQLAVQVARFKIGKMAQQADIGNRVAAKTVRASVTLQASQIDRAEVRKPILASAIDSDWEEF